MKQQTILVTGGAGYIGSHTTVQLIEAGYNVIVFDNFCNSNRSVLDRIMKITGKRPVLIEGDIRDRNTLKNLFEKNLITAVMHFAGLKAVGESEAQPLKYYDNNVSGSVTLLEEMDLAGVRRIVFSSSATVYGNSGQVRYGESTPLDPINVYGKTKLIVENVLRALHKTQNKWQIALLRYFNPVGAHQSGLIGEDPFGTPNNLMPFIAQVASGERERLSIFGNDYPTSDGTGKRDYIHVEDLANGHLAALSKLIADNNALITVNLGTGKSLSVIELVKAFEAASGRPIPFEIKPRRQGDLAEYYADPTLAKQLLGWEAERTVEQMCKDTWRWQSGKQ